MIPMCVSTCPCRANFFGDPEDRESLIYEVMKTNPVKVLEAVAPKVEAKIERGVLKGMEAEAISRRIG